MWFAFLKNVQAFVVKLSNRLLSTRLCFLDHNLLDILATVAH